MDVEDALELLSSQFTNRAVRHYAVSRLKEANDDVSRINLGNNDNVISGIINDKVSVISRFHLDYSRYHKNLIAQLFYFTLF